MEERYVSPFITLTNVDYRKILRDSYITSYSAALISLHLHVYRGRLEEVALYSTNRKELKIM